MYHQPDLFQLSTRVVEHFVELEEDEDEMEYNKNTLETARMVWQVLPIVNILISYLQPIHIHNTSIAYYSRNVFISLSVCVGKATIQRWHLFKEIQ